MFRYKKQNSLVQKRYGMKKYFMYLKKTPHMLQNHMFEKKDLALKKCSRVQNKCSRVGTKGSSFKNTFHGMKKGHRFKTT
jgi:hypothetical protein